ncbi:hypothetical protein PMAC_001577 [Pneumocystis sp. 'macacae']|nr:hypothetical protein PMAC_001577 [Pneumocystis sp. 'macacae']
MITKKLPILHHHRSSMKKVHKKFKSQKKSKKRVDAVLRVISAKKHTSLKADRKNTKKQTQINKRDKAAESNSKHFGIDGISKIIVIVPLCINVNPMDVVRNLSHSVDVNINEFTGISDIFVFVIISLEKRHFLDILDFCKIADFVLLLMSATEEVDSFGEVCLRSIQAQGISTIIPVVQHTNELNSLKRSKEVKKSLLNFINYFFPGQKIYSTDQPQEALNVIRMICVQSPIGVRWRDERSYIIAEEVNWRELNDSAKGILSIKGIIRSKPLNINRLIHIIGWGDYQIDRIIPLDIQRDYNRTYEGEIMECIEKNAIFPTKDQDSLEELAPITENMEDIDKHIDQKKEEKQKSVRVDDYCYFSDNSEIIKRPRRLPPGTSDYQATWILDTDSEEDKDSNSETDKNSLNMDIDDSLYLEKKDDLNNFSSKYEKNISDAKQMKDYESDISLELLSEDKEILENREKEKEEDREFPDEIEIPFNISAKERFKKYRGLKNFRTSPWNPDEYDTNQPNYWKHIYKFSNYKATKKKVIKHAFTDGVKVGTYVIIEIKNCEKEIYSTYSSASPFIIFSLLKYEHLLTTSNFLVTQNTEYELPVKSKDELILQYGPRRILVNPLFSQASNSKSVNNVHKFEKYLHHRRASIASVVCPIFFGAIPILFLKNTPSGISLVATGSFFNTDYSRIIAKRVILTGYPFKIYKRTVIVRYMFFNPEDVEWFKPIQLFTKYGKIGYIKESLGTHGYFKATFDGRINQQDTVAMSLYKRIYPRPGTIWRP